MVISHKFRIFIGRLVRATPNHRMEAASSVQQKDKMADRTTRRLCVSHSFSMAPTSAERERVISGHLANRFGSRLGTNSKLLHGVNIKPISTPNNYLNTVFESRYQLVRELQKQCHPTIPKEKALTRCNSLSACGSKVNTRKNILFVYRPVKEKHIHVDSQKGFTVQHRTEQLKLYLPCDI